MEQETVSLREITADTVNQILKLKVSAEQEPFVAPNAVSIAQAHFNDHAWYRAIYLGETPVGFVMLDDNSEKPEYYLWRFMIGEKYQRRGIGRKATELLADYVRTRPGAKELLVSYVPGEGTPRDFYQKLGFEHDDRDHDGEIGMRLKL